MLTRMLIVSCILIFAQVDANAREFIITTANSIPPYVSRMLHRASDDDRPYMLFDDEIAYLTNLANNGDKSSASRLYLYFKIDRKDLDNADKFLDIVTGGELGIDQYGLGLYIIYFSALDKSFVVGILDDNFVLSKRQINELGKLAKEGNVKAAHRLYEYYINYEGNVEYAISTLLSTAQGGNVISQVIIANLYFSEGMLKDAKVFAKKAEKDLKNSPTSFHDDTLLQQIKSLINKIEQTEH